MRRLIPWALLLTSSTSLLAFIATLTLWARSYQGPDVLRYTSPNQWHLGLISGHGTLDVLYIPRWQQDPEFRLSRYDAHVYYGTRYSKRFLGFGTDVQWPEYGGRYVNVPHWFVAGGTLALAVLSGRAAWRGETRRRRAAAGRCTSCGYDLRATPGRCPECGRLRGTAP